MTQGQSNTTRPDLDTLEKAHRAAGKVKRWHTEVLIQPAQTISDHIFGLMRIYHAIWGEPDPCAFRNILFHDFEELFLGDLPYWTHRFPELKLAYKEAEQETLKAFPDLPEFDSPFNYRIKIIDKIEALEFMLDEVWFGNESLKPPMYRLFDILIKDMKELPTIEFSPIEKYLINVGFTHRFNLVVDGVYRG